MIGAAWRAFCAVRPPGHHATSDAAMGFCLFNSIAVAARHAIDAHGLERVAVVDSTCTTATAPRRSSSTTAACCTPVRTRPRLSLTGDRSETGAGNIFNATPAPGSDGALFRRIWATACCRRSTISPPATAADLGRFRRPSPRPAGGTVARCRRFRLAGRGRWWRSPTAIAEGASYRRSRGGYDLDALAECSVAYLRALGA